MWLNDIVREILRENFPPKKILFRVDAGRVDGLSFGHLSRCLILAKELERSANSKILFLMRDYNEGVTHARLSGYEAKTIKASLLKNRHDNLVMKWIAETKPDCLIVDLPEDDPDAYFEYARQNKILTVCIDDSAKRSYRADVILNSSILVSRSDYRTSLPTTRFLLGMDYFIMDDYITKKHPVIKKDHISVLITFGGSDITGLTENTVRSLAESSWHNVIITVILGPGFKEISSVVDASKPLGDKITIVHYPEDMRGFFLETDLAICAGGMTLYELHKIGVPSIAIASSKHEAEVIQKFANEKLILSGFREWDKQNFLKQFKHALSVISKRSQKKRESLKNIIQ